MRTADPNAPTKQKIMNVAVKLMLSKGFTATSVDEICLESETTKGSFFHFFQSKEDLGKAILDHFYAMEVQRIDAAPFRSEPDPYLRVLGWIDMAIGFMSDPKVPKSCLVGNFIQELAVTNVEMRHLCAEKIAGRVDSFAADAEKAVKARNLGKQVNPQALANLFVAVVQGSIIMIKANNDFSIAVNNLKQFKTYVESQFELKGR